MPQTAKLPDGTTLEFPDDATIEEITAEVNRHAAAPQHPKSSRSSAVQPPPPARKESWTDYLGAAGESLAGMIPALDVSDPATMIANAASEGATEAGVAAGTTASGVARSARIGLAAVPVIGTAMSRLLGPAQAYEGGRAPTHDENVQAVGGGAALAAAIVAPKALSRLEAARARVRGNATPTAAAPEATPPQSALSDSQVEALVSSARLGNPNAAREVPAKLREALTAGTVSGDEASIRAYLSRNPDVADEVARAYQTHGEPAGEATPTEDADGGGGGESPLAATPESGDQPFDVDGYVREQITKRQEARTAGAPEGIKARGKSFLADLKSKLVDSTAPITDLLDATLKRERITLPPSRDINNAIDRVLRAPSIAGQFAEDGGMLDVIRKVPDLDTLDQYLVARQAQSVEEQGFKTGRDLEADQRFLRAARDTYEPFAARVSEYSRQLLDYARDSGLVSADLTARLKELYPDYVPLRRVFSEVESLGGQGTGRGIASVSTQSVVQKLRGSTREVESPIESLLQKTSDVFAQGERNKAAQVLAGYRELPGNPFRIEEVGGKAPTGASTFSYLDDGVKRTFTTTKEVAAAAKSLDVQRLGIVGRILAAPVRVARVGITGVNPAFLASNIVRDQVTAIVNSPRAAHTLANPTNFSRALFEALGHGDLYDELMREGALGTSYDMAREQVPKTVAKVRSERSLSTRLAYTVRHPSQVLRAAEDLLARGEEYTRITQYIAGKSAALKVGLPEAEARIAGARAARENTVNFARRGEWGSVLNSTFLYLNANIQGVRTLGRNLMARPAQTGAKIALTVFTPVAIATAWNMGDPKRRAAYEDIADFDKENNIVLVPPEPTQDEKGRWNVIKVPLSQDVNNLTPLVRRPIEAMYGFDPVSAGEVAQALVGTVSPIGNSKGKVISTIVPQAAKVPAELAMNKNFFTGRDIVPDRPKLRTFKELQTGGTARAIARQLGVSPLLVEEAVRETFGGSGTQVLNATDSAAAAVGAIPGDQIGGESSLDAVRRRFTKATGGEVRRKAQARKSEAKEKAALAAIP